jgi:hypothetical protein
MHWAWRALLAHAVAYFATEGALETCDPGSDGCVTESFYSDSACTKLCTPFSFRGGCAAKLGILKKISFPVYLCDESCTLQGGLCLSTEEFDPGSFSATYNNDGTITAKHLCNDDSCGSCAIEVSLEALPTKCHQFQYSGRTQYVKFTGSVLAKQFCKAPNAFGTCASKSLFTNGVSTADSTCQKKTAVYNFPIPMPCTKDPTEPGKYLKVAKNKDTKTITESHCTDKECDADTCTTTTAAIPQSACLSGTAGTRDYNYQITLKPGTSLLSSSLGLFFVIAGSMALIGGCVFMAYRQRNAAAEKTKGEEEAQYVQMNDIHSSQGSATQHVTVAHRASNANAVKAQVVDGTYRESEAGYNQL